MLRHHLGYLYYAFGTNIKPKSTIQTNLVFTPILSTLAATRYSLAEDIFEKSNMRSLAYRQAVLFPSASDSPSSPSEAT